MVKEDNGQKRQKNKKFNCVNEDYFSSKKIIRNS